MEVILMVGIPGSGKSTLAAFAFPHHVHVSLDVIKEFRGRKRFKLIRRYFKLSNSKLSKNRMIAEPAKNFQRQMSLSNSKLSKNRMVEHVLIHDALSAGKNVVVDDTNVSRLIRSRHVLHAREFGARVNVVYFKNIPRAYLQNSKRVRPLRKGILDKFLLDLEPPQLCEGFDFIQLV